MFRLLFDILFAIFGGIVGFIGRRTAWRINKKDEIYLENYYNKRVGIDGDTKYAKDMTDLERKKIVTIKEARFWGRLNK